MKRPKPVLNLDWMTRPTGYEPVGSYGGFPVFEYTASGWWPSKGFTKNGQIFVLKGLDPVERDLTLRHEAEHARYSTNWFFRVMSDDRVMVATLGALLLGFVVSKPLYWAALAVVTGGIMEEARVFYITREFTNPKMLIRLGWLAAMVALGVLF